MPIITGSANGIGKAATIRFLEEGAKVVIADIQAEEGKQFEKELTERGYDVLFYQVNVAKKEEVEKMVEKVKEHYGKIDILINNAGITRDAMLVKMSEEQFDEVINVNLKGVFNCTQAVSKVMIEQGHGKIINTSSVKRCLWECGANKLCCCKSGNSGHDKNVGEGTWKKGYKCERCRSRIYENSNG